MNSDTRLLPLNEVLVGMIVSNELPDIHGGLITIVKRYAR